MGIEKNTDLNSETRELMQCCIYFLGVGEGGHVQWENFPSLGNVGTEQFS